MRKMQWLVPAILFLSNAVFAASPEEEAACTRLKMSLASLLHGTDDDRLLIAESAEDAFDDLDEDPCSRSVMKAVDRLIEREPDAFLVFRLIEQWAELDDRAEPYLLALERDEAEVREAAARAIDDGLADLEPEDLERVLRVWRRENDPRTRLLLIDVLGGEEENPDVQEQLLAVARSDVPEEAAAALDVLNLLEDPTVVLEAWRRPEPKVRDAALRWMIGHVRAPGVLNVVLDVAKNEALPQREQAVRGLFKLTDARAIEVWRAFVLDNDLPHEPRLSLIATVPRTDPWRGAMEEVAQTPLPIDEALRAAARRRLDPESEVIRCFATATSHDPAIVGRLVPSTGSDLVPCLARPDRPSAIVRDPLPGGAAVYSFHTWKQEGPRWLGVLADDPDLDDGHLCWIEERRLAPFEEGEGDSPR